MNHNLLDKYPNDIKGLDIYGKLVIYKDKDGNTFISGNKIDDDELSRTNLDLYSAL